MARYKGVKAVLLSNETCPPSFGSDVVFVSCTVPLILTVTASLPLLMAPAKTGKETRVNFILPAVAVCACASRLSVVKAGSDPSVDTPICTSVMTASAGEKLISSGIVWVASAVLCWIDRYGPTRLPVVLIGLRTGCASAFGELNNAEVTFNPTQFSVSSIVVIVGKALSPMLVALTAPLIVSSAVFACALTHR